PASGCARSSNRARSTHCPRPSPRSAFRAASTTAAPGPRNTPKPPNARWTASKPTKRSLRYAAWPATPPSATTDPRAVPAAGTRSVLPEALVEEAVHHPVRALRLARVVDAARRPLGRFQREAEHRTAEVDERPVGAGRVHCQRETRDVPGGAAVVRAVEHQQRGLDRIRLRRRGRRQAAMEGD